MQVNKISDHIKKYFNMAYSKVKVKVILPQIRKRYGKENKRL